MFYVAMSVIQQNAESHINSENTVILMRGKCRKMAKKRKEKEVLRKEVIVSLYLTE